jgi:hypothetical protein
MKTNTASGGVTSISISNLEICKEYGKADSQDTKWHYTKEEVIAFANYCVELQYNSFKTGEDIEAESMEDLLEQFNLKK